MDIIFLIGRVLFGGILLIMAINHFMKLGFMAGYATSKNVPMPRFAVFISGVFLAAGAIGIGAGILVEWAVFSLALFLIPVSLMMHNFWAIDNSQQRMMEMVNFMKNMAILGGAIMTLAIGEWPFAIFPFL